MQRRDLLILLAGASPLARSAETPANGLKFPVDFGAHPGQRTEWWYVTGSLTAGARLWGFQVTFFRSSTGLASGLTDAPRSRFAATELVFAHAALTDLEQRRLRHDQRIARSGFGIAAAALGDTDVVLRDWRLVRSEATSGAASNPASGEPPRGSYHAVVSSESAGFALDLRFTPTQPVLLQGEAGLSRKGPLPQQTSRYYSEPQLAVQGTLRLAGAPIAVEGRAWLDHEWSDAFLDPQATGWDWIGMNLADGSALTAFRLRRADGSALYAGGSFRRAGESVRNFAATEVSFAPGRIWQSAASRARYPVQWVVSTPAGRYTVNALLDDQELDSRNSTGAVYWEGLSDLLDESGRRIGRGYLEMTGYAAALRL